MVRLSSTILTAVLAIASIAKASPTYDPLRLHNGKRDVSTRVSPQEESANFNSSSSISMRLEEAITIVEKAQIAQGKLNVARYHNALKGPAFRPTSSVTAGPYNVASVRAAATMVAEYEARKNPPPREEQKRAGAWWMSGMTHGSVAIGGSSGYSVCLTTRDTMYSYSYHVRYLLIAL
jgi:hypothetical protein